MPKCECGCKREAPTGAEFIEGHEKIWEENQRGKCGCGCGGRVRWGSRFIVGHHNRVPEYKKRAREINLGPNNPAYGKTISEETRKKRSESMTNKYKEDLEWKERRDNSVREAFQRLEVRERLSAGQMGRTVSEETREKIRKSNKETWADEELRKEHSDLMKEAMNQPETRAQLAEIHSSEEWSRRMRELMLDVWADPEQRRHRLERMAEVRQTEEYKRNLRDNIRRGPDHPNWRGGYAKGPYGPGYTHALRRAVRERDSFTCMLCGIGEEESSVPHSVHHIDYDKYNNTADNLITLCVSCHGKTNVNREHWQRFLTELITYPEALCTV